LSPLLVGNWDCYPSIYETCEASGCSCSCSFTADCNHDIFCQATSVLSDTFECPTASLCQDLEDVVTALESYTTGLDQDHLSDVDQAVIDCETKTQAQLELCTGHGGAGAGGQSGAGNGGQSAGGHAGD
jgi:hypothetical protein